METIIALLFLFIIIYLATIDSRISNLEVAYKDQLERIKYLESLTK